MVWLDRPARALLQIIIRLTHANVWESMGNPYSCTQFLKSHNFYYKSHENLYPYYKSHAPCLNVQ